MAKRGQPNPAASRPLSERFWSKVDKAAPGGCWQWIGALRHGHGTIHVAMPNKIDYAHRVVFGLLGREIPGGTEVDHLCRNRACVNPAHLRFVTHEQNVVENSLSPSALNRLKTHCKRGHPLPLERDYRGQRQCASCSKLRPSYIKRLKSQSVKGDGQK